MHARRGALCEFREICRVAPSVFVVDTVVTQALSAVRTQRLQDAVSRPTSFAAHGHHRLVDKRGQQIECVVLVRTVLTAHTVRRV